MAKLILYVILQNLSRISMHGDIDKSIEDGNDGYKTSQSLSTLLKGAASKVLAFAAVVYFLTHYTAPLLDKLGPIADAVTMIIPGLQIVAIAVFAYCSYLITSKMNAYRKRRNQKEQISLGQNLMFLASEEGHLSKYTLLSIIWITFAEYCFSILESLLLSETDIVIPIVISFLLLPYILYSALPPLFIQFN